MSFEVEVKYPVPSRKELLDRLSTFQVEWKEVIQEEDIYFQHPCRDFSRTDEALRIRRAGQKAFLTFKGRKTDPLTKTRQEIEIPLDPEPRLIRLWRELLERLGFRPVAEVVKSRLRGYVNFQGTIVQVCIDDVTELGTFLELEVTANESELESARQLVLSLARQFGFENCERRSYLELLLAKRSAKFPASAEGVAPSVGDEAGDS